MTWTTTMASLRSSATIELDAPIVFTDPDQASVRGGGRRHAVGRDGVDDEHRVGLADAVASR
jgi:hypothetical protein